jgi:hypothetical protein
MEFLEVTATNSKTPQKSLSLLSESGQRSFLKVHALAPVGSGNRIILDPRHRNRIFVENKEDSSDPIQISPHFETYSTLPVGSSELRLKLSELVAAADFADIDFLEQFHYRRSNAVSIRETEETETTTSAGGPLCQDSCRVHFLRSRDSGGGKRERNAAIQ